MESNPLFEKPWTLSTDKILERTEVNPERGLNEKRVGEQRKKYGKNKLRKIQKKSAWKILLDQFESVMMLVMGGAAVLSFALGEIVDGIAIAVAMVINAFIGFFTELNAVRSMEALQKMDKVEAKVLREESAKVVPATEIVPGDIVLLESGDVVTADMRLLEANKLQANESALTGESVPVSKQTDKIAEEVPLADRTNLVFKGTAITRGSGKGVVYATGMSTELGGISSLVEEAQQEQDPLEKRLNRLSTKLVWVIGIVAIIVGGGGIIAGQKLVPMLKTAVILGIAAIPEGLIIVATMALARGMHRMAKRNALVRRLAAVQTLGATNTILTDKTGTLTENQMTATVLHFYDGKVDISGEGLERKGDFSLNGNKVSISDYPIVRQILEIGVLCTNASLPEEEKELDKQAVGDPMEVALLVAGAKAGIGRKELLEEKPEEKEIAFDPDNKMMATYHKKNGSYLVAVKGAPDAVLEKSENILTGDGQKTLDENQKKEWMQRNNEMAQSGLRVLAFSRKEVNSTDKDPYEKLTFLGLIGLLDPPRDEVKSAIKTCKNAGIRVVMVTGDQIPTAENIARQLDITDGTEVRTVEGKEIENPEDIDDKRKKELLKAPIYARVSPAQKLNLIELHQEAGSIVAMTGDGVNDAPALKKANIGIAMGKRGKQVAKEAADIILQDDAFSTIVTAVEHGRIIFNNIRKFVVYLLSGNMGEILIVALASFAGAPLPLLPLQILYINVVNDAFPALALGLGQDGKDVMGRPPRDPDEPVITRKHWYAITGYGFLIASAVLAGFWIALEHFHFSREKAVTVVFLSLTLGRLWHVFNMRNRGSGFLKNQIVKNPYVWIALSICTGLVLLALYIPALAGVLKLVHPGTKGWLLAIAISFVPYVVGQLWISLRGKRSEP